MVSLSHVLQILITAKDSASPTLKGVGESVAGFVAVVSNASKVLTLLKFVAGVAFLPFKLATVVVAGLTIGLAALTVGVVGLVATLATLPHALATGMMKITEYASRLDLVRRAFLGIAGEAAPAMLKALKEVTAYMVEEIDLLQTHNKAYTLLGQNLSKRLPELMRYITKIAVATGEDITNLTELALRSVGRLSMRWMAYVGVVITTEEAQARAAEMTGKLTDQLTRQEEMAGMLDLVLKKLAAGTSALPEAMGTAAQMAAALRVQWKELYGDLTTFLLPVARALYPVVMKIVLGFRQLISEGGALYRPIRTITATFVVLIEVLGDLWGKIQELTTQGTSAIENFANKIISMGWKAFSWGAHMITNFAAGIIKGASIALIGAMNFISKLLVHWLGPGSPPLVASNIGLWGASAFTEFLKGFSMADFDVLEGIQGPLRRALDILVDLERLAPLEAFDLFVGLSADLAAAIDELNRTGEVSASMLERLSQVGGAYGDELAELFRRYASLHAATEAYTAAQERLKAATEAEDAATSALSKEAREYNKLVRAGADPAVLRGKLAGVKASYASLVAARLEAEEAEEAEERAREQLRLQQEQVRLQERLLNQLIAMAEAQAAALAAAAGGKDGPVIPEILWPDVYPIPIDQAFEDLKNRIRAKFQELWDELSKIWEESEAGKWVTRLQERWDAFRKDTLGPLGVEVRRIQRIFLAWYADIAKPWLLEKWKMLKIWAAAEWPKMVQFVIDEWQKWVDWWEEEGPRIEGHIDSLLTKMEELGIGIPLILMMISARLEIWRILVAAVMGAVRWSISLVLDLLEGDWPKVFEPSEETVDKWAQWVIDIGAEWELLKKWGTETWEALETTAALAWSGIKTTAETKWAEIKTSITTKVQEIYNKIRYWIDVIKLYWDICWNLIKSKVTDIWNSIKTSITMKVLDIYNKVRFWIGLLKTWWSTTWEAIKTKVTDIWNSIKASVTTKVQGIYDKVIGKIREIKNKIGGMAGQFWGAGWDLIKALGDGMGALGEWLKHRLRNIIDIAISFMKQALGWYSPPKVLVEMGEAMVEALAIGMDHVADLPGESLDRIAKGLALNVEPTFLIGAGGAAAGAGGTQVIIHNHFGRDSIRSDADIYKLSKQIKRSTRLRGAREML